MKVHKANRDREDRYVRRASLLEEELALVAKPDAHIIAIGQKVRSFLAQVGIEASCSLLHYSPLAASAWNAAVQGKEEEFKVV
jgi:hypothetical protein